MEPWQKGVLGVFAAYGLWKYVDNKFNLGHDLATMKKMGPVFREQNQFMMTPGFNVVNLWERTLAKCAKKTMFIDAETGKTITFGEMDLLSNKVAHWVVKSGIKPGECIAIVMENRAEYCATWLGFAKAGVISALINNNTVGKPLVHAITVAKSVAAVFGTECAEAGAAVADQLKAGGCKVLASYGAGGHAGTDKPAWCDLSLDESLPGLPTAPVDVSRRKDVKVTSPWGYIYTSGTTGLPKACNISHVKFLNFSMVSYLYEMNDNDVIYGSGMPMYHSAANLGVSAVIRRGCTMVVRRKFSARNHWSDCKKFNATAMQYIGELCRYLLAAPKGAADKDHRVRIAFGNGLRPEIWNEFQRRFNIVEIGEFYGSTEGNAASMHHCKNYQGQGAVGRAGTLFNMVRPMLIVKFDVENEIPIRDKSTGFCIRCAPNEPGELIAPIKKLKTAAGDQDDFEGYTSKEATDKKILKDVFAKGDRWFRTGDLLRQDQKGYYYFVDRIGDTFRWKGENVSTMEVSEVVSAFPGIVDANVYGVQIPGKDGRACMVAMTTEGGKKPDAEKLATYCRANLPGYSIPVFIRFLPENVDLTGTLKHKKVEYRNEGCDPTKVKDEMWWYNPAKKKFESFGENEMNLIKGGKAKL